MSAPALAVARPAAARSRGRGPSARASNATRAILPRAQPKDRRGATCACGGICPRCDAEKDSHKAAPPLTALENPALEREATAAAIRVLRPAKAPPLVGAPSLNRRSQVRDQTWAGRPIRASAQGIARTSPHSASPARAPPLRHRAVRATERPSARLGPGAPLPERTRDWFEERYDADFSAVRIHSGPPATALIESYGVLGFTFGNHIVLSPRIGALETPLGKLVVAHELAHTLQQTAAPVLEQVDAQHLPRGPPSRWTDNLVRGRCAVGVQCFPDISLPTFDDVTGAVVSVGEGAWEGVAYVGGAAADFAVDSLASVVEYFAPGLLAFLRGGYAGQLSDLFCSGLDALVGALLSPLEEIDLVSTIQTTFTALGENVRGMWSGLGKGASAALGALLRPLVKALEIFGDPIIKGLSDAADTADGIFSGLWENIGVPVLAFLEAVGGAVWQGFNDTIVWLEEITGPLRAAAEDAWDWLCAQFDLAWQSTGGIRQWLSDQASALWDSFLETIEPIKGPILAVAGVLVLLSPLGPIVLLTQVIPPLWEKIVWLWNNWNSEDVLVAAREILANDILPGIIGLVSGVASAISGAASWLAGVTATLAGTFASVLGVFGANSCLATVTRVLNHVASEFQSLADWAEDGFTGLGDAIRAVFDALRAIFEPILDFLVRLIMVALNPPLLPIAITAAIWLFCPDDLKPPVINFVLDFLIQFLRGFPAFLTGLAPLASILKAGTIGFLEEIRGQDDPTKVAASNKVANIAAGGGPQFVAGYALGLLEGIIDGILDPIRLIVMIVRVVSAVCKAIGDRLAPLVLGAVPPLGAAIGGYREALAVPPLSAASQGPAQGAAPAEASSEATVPEAPAPVSSGGTATAIRAAPQGEERTTGHPNPSPAEAPPPVEERFGSAPAGGSGATLSRIHAGRGQDSARPPPPALAVQTEGAPSAGPAEEHPAESISTPATPGTAIGTPASGGAELLRPELGAGAVGEGEAAEFEMLPGDAISDETLALAISPGTIGEVSAGGAQLAGADAELEQGGESEARSAGGSVRGLANLLGDVWDQVIAGARGLGRRAGAAFMKFLTYSDYVIGNKIGYVCGLILLEVLLTIFTAGGWAGASAAAKFLRPIVRLLDIGGEIFGAVARGLRAVRGPLVRGLGAARSFLGRFRIVRSIIDKLDNVAQALFRFGDEAAGAGSRAGREAAEAAGEQAGRRADDLAGGAGAATTRAAGESAEAAADRAAREAMEGASSRTGREAVEETGGGAVRAVDEPGLPTVRDDALKAAQFAEAEIAARTVATANDGLDTPIPGLMVQLIALKRRYRWIDTFTAQLRAPGHYRVEMVASPGHPVDEDYTPARGATADESGVVFHEPGPAPLVERAPRRPGRPREPAAPPASRTTPEPGERFPDLEDELDDVARGTPPSASEAGEISVSRLDSPALAREAGVPDELLGDSTVMMKDDLGDIIGDGPPRGRPAPDQLPVAGREVSRSAPQNFDVQADMAFLRNSPGFDPGSLRVNQMQVDLNELRVGTNRPDLQATINGRRVHVEYDRAPGTRALDHARRILSNDPDAIVILKIVDFDRVVRRFAIGSAPARLPQSVPTALAHPGDPLPAHVRAEMELFFQADFSRVRVHTGPPAATAARDVNAKAFAVGKDVAFAPGAYAPETLTGRALLAHELAHTIQQSASPGEHVPSRVSSPTDSTENEARVAADAWKTDRSAQRNNAATKPADTPAVNIRERSARRIARTPESLNGSLPVHQMSDDEIRAELREIHLWVAGQVSTTEDTVPIETSQKELQAELKRRHREKAKVETAREKPRKRGKQAKPAIVTSPSMTSPMPRSAMNSFNIDELTPEEKATELQQIDEWMDRTAEKDWKKQHVRGARSALSGKLAAQESAPLLESHDLRLASVVDDQLKFETHNALNRYQAIKELQDHLYKGRMEAENAISAIDLIYRQRNEMRIRSSISETFGRADDPELLLDRWSKARDLLRAAEDALDNGNFSAAARLCNDSIAASLSAARGVEMYFGDVVKGAGRAVTGLEVVKTAAAATVTIGTGGGAGLVVGGLYSGTQSLYQQASEIHYGLRDKIDWAGIGFDTVIGGLSGFMGGKLGNLVLGRLLGKAATASFGRKALSIAVSDYIAGRAGSTIHLTARTAFDLARGQDITWDEYLDRLADQITDPTQAAMELITGYASRRATAALTADKTIPTRALPPARETIEASPPPPIPVRSSPADPQTTALPPSAAPPKGPIGFRLSTTKPPIPAADLNTPSRPVAGFAREIALAPAPAPMPAGDFNTPSRPVAGFARKIEPAPAPVPAPPGPPVVTQMPQARVAAARTTDGPSRPATETPTSTETAMVTPTEAATPMETATATPTGPATTSPTVTASPGSVNPARTTPIAPADAAGAYANRFNGRLVNDAGLEGIFVRTKERPTLSVDRRAASVELRTIEDVLTNGYDGRPVAQVRVLPQTNRLGERTPDLVLTFADGTTTRIEIATFTSAPHGHSAPHAPLAAATRERSAAPLTRRKVESAILNKAASRPTRFSQLDVPLAGVAPGGRITIGSTHKPLSIANADAAVANLGPQLGNHVQSISLTFPDSVTGQRTTLVYNRQGITFVR